MLGRCDKFCRFRELREDREGPTPVVRRPPRNEATLRSAAFLTDLQAVQRGIRGARGLKHLKVWNAPPRSLSTRIRPVDDRHITVCQDDNIASLAAAECARSGAWRAVRQARECGTHSNARARTGEEGCSPVTRITGECASCCFAAHLPGDLR